MDAFKTILQLACSQVVELTCNNTKINEGLSAPLISILNHESHRLEIFQLSNSFVNPRMYNQISAGLNENMSLQQLYVDNCEVSDGYIPQICAITQKCKSLLLISLANNKIT